MSLELAARASDLAVAAPARALRVLCLFKRRYMRKDVIVDRYARLYELPRELARRGHVVHGVCLNYRGKAPPHATRDDAGGGDLSWQSHDLGRWVVPGLLRYRRAVRAAIERFEPDLLLGGSDCLLVALTRQAASAARLPYAVDLYDNYASFGLAKVPGLARAYAHALRDAAAITCVSAPLSAMVERDYAPRGTVATLESTISAGVFAPRERAASRARLGLPAGIKLIGTAGALDSSRGTAALYEAYARLRAVRDDVGLALAGPRAGGVPLPDVPGIYHLGELPHADIAHFFAALDTAVICMRDSPFGRYAFPQKAYEIIACRTPLVAARVGAMASLLAAYPDSLYEADDAVSLLRCLLSQLEQPQPVAIEPPTWSDQAARLEAILFAALAPA